MKNIIVLSEEAAKSVEDKNFENLSIRKFYAAFKITNISPFAVIYKVEKSTSVSKFRDEYLNVFNYLKTDFFMKDLKSALGRKNPNNEVQVSTDLSFLTGEVSGAFNKYVDFDKPETLDEQLLNPVDRTAGVFKETPFNAMRY